MKRFLVLTVCVALLSGCAAQKQWSAVSGSKADGVVKLGYSYGAFEVPELEAGQGDRLATQKCLAWGYTGSEAFGASMSDCTGTNQYGCVAWRVTSEYQCTGGKGSL